MAVTFSRLTTGPTLVRRTAAVAALVDERLLLLRGLRLVDVVLLVDLGRRNVPVALIVARSCIAEEGDRRCDVQVPVPLLLPAMV